MKDKSLIACVILLLPAYLVKVDLWLAPTNLFEIPALLVSGWIFWQRRKMISEVGKKVVLENKAHVFFLSLFVCGSVISLFANGLTEAGAGIIKSWVVVPMIFGSACALAISKTDLRTLYLSYFFSAASVAVLGAAGFFSGMLTYDGRLSGIFGSPNYLAMYLSPAVIVGTFFYRHHRREKKERVFLAIATGLMVGIIFLTKSYASWAAVALALALFAIFEKRLSWAMLCGVGLTMLFMSQASADKFRDVFAMEGRSSLESRIMIWKSAIKILKDNWVLGIGPGNFQETYLGYQRYFAPYLEWAVPHPHNLFLAVWLQSGITGVAGFLGAVVKWFGEMWKLRKDDYGFVTMAVMAYVLLHGMVDTTYFKNDLATIFWVFFFALFVIKKPATTNA